MRLVVRTTLALTAGLLLAGSVAAQDSTRLLRQPSISDTHVAFTYGSDVWVAPRGGGDAVRITSTPAVEEHPMLSPDGRHIAFTSNRSGTASVYVVPVEGGMPTRLTWHPSGSQVRGWSPDGSRVLFASGRETAPRPYMRLWTVSVEGGPSELIQAPWAFDGWMSPDGGQIAIDRMDRWDEEWRSYRGGQNTSLVVMDLDDLGETFIPNEDRSTDVHPVWMSDTVYFLSDRDWVMNVWAYDTGSGDLRQVTRFDDIDAKWLAGNGDALVVEHDGWIHELDPASGALRRIDVTVRGDFPWAETRWQDVGRRATSAYISPTGQRVVVEARGEIFTVPVENGDTRNLTRSSDAADRRPIWSPDGDEVAWFREAGDGVYLMIGTQDGMSEPRAVDIGESHYAWEPTWSPDGELIAFVDNVARIRVVDVASGDIRTVDVGGTSGDRGGMGLEFSPDSRWLAYAKSAENRLNRITVWSRDTDQVTPLTDEMANSTSPSWDRDGRHLYFLASTDVALGSGWANTSAMMADPSYGVYVAVLRADDPNPFPLQSDEEEVKDEGGDEEGEGEGGGSGSGPAGRGGGNGNGDVEVQIDFDGFENRILALPMPVRRYFGLVAGPKGSVFVAEFPENARGLTLHKFSMEDREAEEFVAGIQAPSVSADGSKMLFRQGPNWRVVDTARKPSGNNGRVAMDLRMQLDRMTEWHQIFDEMWRYQRDLFYAPNTHGADWEAVRDRYRPLVQWVRHRHDLNYLLDIINGELAVGHSFVSGGDYPAVDTSRVGLLGADFVADDGRWQIDRIYTFESWNPSLTAPLAGPGINVQAGYYLVGVNGVELTADQDPFMALDGTAGRQTVLHINDRPTMDGHWTETVEPLRSENALRQRAWVEDNRRMVDELSGGRLAYVWVPNTGGPGYTSFNRYFFAQQHKEGAVIDERYNGGGLLDDYMVDLMTRTTRAAITNEAPGGTPYRLPAGILGPKVLLINELAGSGGDFFPWVFRHQNAGPLIGMRTWGGLVAAAGPVPTVDGGRVTAPASAVYDPENSWVAENEGVPPDIEVFMDARSVAAGRDPQIERGVREVLRLIQENPAIDLTPPPFSSPNRRPGGGNR
jgi:tricorn protease